MASVVLVLPADKHPIDLHALDAPAKPTLESRLFADCLDSRAECDKWSFSVPVPEVEAEYMHRVGLHELNA